MKLYVPYFFSLVIHLFPFGLDIVVLIENSEFSICLYFSLTFYENETEKQLKSIVGALVFLGTYDPVITEQGH